jgi:O-antigen ligase
MLRAGRRLIRFRDFLDKTACAETRMVYLGVLSSHSTRPVIQSTSRPPYSLPNGPEPVGNGKVARVMKLVKWIVLLIFLQCFYYKAAHSALVWNLGITITPDRLVFVIILMLAVLKLLSGELQFPSLGKTEGYMLLFALTCTASSFLSGSGFGSSITGYNNLTTLVDFIYNPFIVFIIAKSIPHSHKKLGFLCVSFLILGAYLAINGAFEHFGLHALVWPTYILDPSVGTQFGRTRGSFASSTYLGGALLVTFLFYVYYTTRVEGGKLYWAYMMTFVTAGVIYTTYQRSVWLSFSYCLVVLAIVKSGMKRIAIMIAGVICLVFITGVASKFSFTEGTLFSGRQETVEYRLVNYLTLLEMSKANPILGIGYGNFKREWPQYVRPIPGIEIEELTDGNHNTFLGLLAEVGLVGIILYLAIFYNMFRVGLRVFREGGRLEREFALLFLLVAGSYMIDANFHDMRSTQFLNTDLFLLFGTVAAVEAKLGVGPRARSAEQSLADAPGGRDRGRLVSG